MTRIIHLTLLMIALCASLISTIWLTGHSQPFPVTALFTRPDMTPCEQPCLFGIRPGQTSYADAITLLHTHPFTRTFTANLEGDIFQSEAMVLVLSRDSASLVSTITLSVRPGSPSFLQQVSLGQVINVLGTPDVMVDNPILNQSYFKASRLVFVHRHTQLAHPGAGDPFESLTVYATLPDSAADGVPWRGF